MQVSVALRIKEMGYALILTDKDSGCACRSTIFTELDTFDVGGHESLISTLVKVYEIRGVLTVASIVIIPWRCICSWPSRYFCQSLEACRNKFVTRSLLSDGNILQPKFYLAKNLRAARKFIANWGVQRFKGDGQFG